MQTIEEVLVDATLSAVEKAVAIRAAARREFGAMGGRANKGIPKPASAANGRLGGRPRKKPERDSSPDSE